MSGSLHIQARLSALIALVEPLTLIPTQPPTVSPVVQARSRLQASLPVARALPALLIQIVMRALLAKAVWSALMRLQVQRRAQLVQAEKQTLIQIQQRRALDVPLVLSRKRLQ